VCWLTTGSAPYWPTPIGLAIAAPLAGAVGIRVVPVVSALLEIVSIVAVLAIRAVRSVWNLEASPTQATPS
jgi:hypothetical protein